ncbi:hypothetical protein MKX01_021660 [Papaver californicum]|nr:hypothetical protein MKX01_021660 [Papaver californicum]
MSVIAIIATFLSPLTFDFLLVGYSLRYMHNTKVEKKLESIVKAVCSWLARWKMVCQQEIQKRADENTCTVEITIELKNEK